MNIKFNRCENIVEVKYRNYRYTIEISNGMLSVWIFKNLLYDGRSVKHFYTRSTIAHYEARHWIDSRDH